MKKHYFILDDSNEIKLMELNVDYSDKEKLNSKLSIVRKEFDRATLSRDYDPTAFMDMNYLDVSRYSTNRVGRRLSVYNLRVNYNKPGTEVHDIFKSAFNGKYPDASMTTEYQSQTWNRFDLLLFLYVNTLLNKKKLLPVIEKYRIFIDSLQDTSKSRIPSSLLLAIFRKNFDYLVTKRFISQNELSLLEYDKNLESIYASGEINENIIFR